MIFFFFKNAVNRDRRIKISTNFLTCKGQHALLSFKVKRCSFRYRTDGRQVFQHIKKLYEGGKGYTLHVYAADG